MKVYVDFDRTLFDCDRFLMDLYAIISKYNISKEVFKECQNQCKKKGFNPYNILNLVNQKYPIDENIYKEINSLMKKTNEYLYPDSISFLKYLKSLKYEVIILTKGNISYQKEKVSNSGLEGLYDKLIVTMKHKGNLNISYKDSVFIDDNPTEIMSILDRKPKIVIRIQRKRSLYSDVVMDYDLPSYNSLKEIVESEILN